MIDALTAAQDQREMTSFRTRLKQLMLVKSMELGRPLSQTEVAKSAGVSLATIQRWYDGSFKRIDADTLYPLLAYFGCKFEDLIEPAEDAE